MDKYYKTIMKNSSLFVRVAENCFVFIKIFNFILCKKDIKITNYNSLHALQ